jgi:hypothetical protein
MDTSSGVLACAPSSDTQLFNVKRDTDLPSRCSSMDASTRYEDSP